MSRVKTTVENHADSPLQSTAKVKTGQLPFAKPDISDKEIDGVVECLRSGWLTSGAVVREFEAQFAKWLGVAHAISCSSATTAALLILEALGVGPGTDVVVPAWTFSGPAMMAHKLGARVVFCDVDENFQMTSETLSRVVTRQTRVVMPTHFAGRSCDMQPILNFCRARKIAVVDDAAHAFPTYDTQGIAVGAQGAEATFFSFYATKTLTTGDGGMIVTADTGLAHRLRASRSNGIDRDVFDRYSNPETSWRYNVGYPGWKANMTDIEAAIGIGQLGRTGKMLMARKVIAAKYNNAFKQLEADRTVDRPEMVDGHAWHIYPLKVHGDRDLFIQLMRKQGVMCSMHFIPLYEHSFWAAHGAQSGAIPQHVWPATYRLAKSEVSLPIYSTMTSDEVARVITATRKALKSC